MLGRDEYLRRILDADGVVGRRVHHQQRLVQLLDMRHQAMLGDIVEEFALYAERPSRERNLHVAVFPNVLDAVLEEVGDMRGIGGCGDGDDRLGIRNLTGGGQHGGAAEAVADQDRGAFSGLAQMIGGADEIGDVGWKRRIGEIAFAGAEPGEVKSQHGDALGGQRDRDAPGRQHILPARAGDAASFARAQAGILDPATALSQGYRRNNSGNYAEAAEFFDTLLQRVTPAGSNSGADRQYGEYLINRALQQSDLGNYAEADALFARADSVITTDPVELRLRRNFRTIHLLNQNDLDDALKLLDTPIAADSGQAAPPGEVDAATAAALNNSTPLARQLNVNLNLSLTPAEKVAVLDAQALALRGHILRLQGRSADANLTLVNVLYRLDQIRSGQVVSLARLRAQVLTDQAALAEGAGEPARAEGLLRQAAALLAAEYPGSIVTEAADATLAGFLARSGKSAAALALFRQVVTELGAQGGASSGIADLLQPYFALLVERLPAEPALADDLFLATQVLLRPGVADTQAVLARELSGGSGEAGRMFRQSLNEARRAEGLRVELARLTALPSPTSMDQAGIAAVRAQIDQIDAEQSAIEAQLAKFPAYRAIRTQALTLAQLRAALHPGEAYWKLTVVGDAIYSILVTPEQTSGWQVPLRPAELSDKVDAIRATISIVENGQRITSPLDVPTTRALYVALAGPAAADLPKLHHLIFEPDGAMQRLPVTLLIDEQAGVDRYLARIKDPNADPFDMTEIDWLGSHAAVSIALSARAFRDVRATPPSTAPREYLGLGHNVPATSAVRAASFVGSPDADCRWALSTWGHPIAPTELFSAQRVIGAGTGESEAKVITDANFTDTAIIANPQLGDYRILHFATHGLVTAPRAGCPATPALLTSFGGDGSDGLLSFGEIFNLHLDADLVVLSACDTAGTADIATTRAAGIATGGGNAMDGLVRAFIGAGARSVLASHWPAPDDFQATEHLIDGLFTAPPAPRGRGLAAGRAAADGGRGDLAPLLLGRFRADRRRRPTCTAQAMTETRSPSRRWRTLFCTGAAIIGLLLAPAVAAQTAPPRSAVPLTREEINRVPTGTQPTPPSRLTVTGGIEHAACALDSPRFASVTVALKDVAFDDLGPVDPASLRPAFGPYVGQTVPIATICEIRDAAATILRRQGYLAAVEVPPQHIRDGVIHLQVVLGRLVAIHVRGDVGHAGDLIAAYLETLKRSRYFNQAEAERALLLAGDLPGYDIRLALRPAGTAPGELIGEVTVARVPLRTTVNIQNYGSHAVGRWSGLVSAELNDLVGLGDRLVLGYYNTADIHEQSVAQAAYEVRPGTNGLTLAGRFTYAWTRPDTGDGDPLHARTLIATAEASYPLVRRQAQTLRLAGGFDLISQKLRFGAAPFTDDQLRVAYAQLDFSFLDHDSIGSTQGYSAAEPHWRAAGSLELRQGIHALGASSGCGPAPLYTRCAATPSLSRLDGDPQATLIRFSGTFELRPAPNLTFALSPRAQYAFDPLLSYEQYSGGNYTIGRGFDPGVVIGDSGIGFQGEIRIGRLAPRSRDGAGAAALHLRR